MSETFSFLNISLLEKFEGGLMKIHWDLVVVNIPKGREKQKEYFSWRRT